VALKFEELRVLLNSFAADLKTQRHRGSAQPKAVRETGTEYANDQAFPLFSTEELASLATTPNT
jgi:hypothetical protein